MTIPCVSGELALEIIALAASLAYVIGVARAKARLRRRLARVGSRMVDQL